MTAPRDQLADALADRYLLEEVLGRGASCTVYLAQDLRHRRRVAVKSLGCSCNLMTPSAWFTWPAELASDPLWPRYAAILPSRR